MTRGLQISGLRYNLIAEFCLGVEIFIPFFIALLRTLVIIT
ncbi:hypothetical protein MC7420_3626 [Coleofasciculus chthonoplastes PCC 7420]|uniref:Uncharacterized protein n=1 Tax=Coleofasciculus chthonoplastes PCC 7420 TaxID=118168 RepID=B4VWS9_9CYAN|nr:hypothetical protein MC7420_3626 [Coleofasciculus chthonoplastes PCC 7420]